MPVFDVDYNLAVKYYLPVRLRQLIMYAWLKVQVSGVVNQAGIFSINRTSNLYVLAHNSQVCHMQAALNDTFDPISRGIYISDGIDDEPLYIYDADEDKPLWLGLVSEEGSTSYPDPQPLYLNSESYTMGTEFIVYVPVAVSFDTNYMKALINFYRLPGKTYSIVTF